MNPEIKAKWIEALRSGNYAQTRDGVLYDGEGYCCLGVLCDVVGLKPEYNEERDHWYVHDKGLRDYEVLPEHLAERLGLTICGDLPEKVWFDGKEFADLAHLNDRGADFNFIADVIEKQL